MRCVGQTVEREGEGAGEGDLLARPTFCAEHRNGIDAKSRVVMPAPYRPHFAAGGFLTVWEGRCLAAFPRGEWERYVAAIRRSLASSAEEQPTEILREMFRSTIEFKLDVQGRMVLDADTRARVGIGSEVRFVGFDRRVELWPVEVDLADEAEQVDRRETLSVLQRSYDLPFGEV